ncbi:MAG: acyltransferase [Caldilineaceae bacterium]
MNVQSVAQAKEQVLWSQEYPKRGAFLRAERLHLAFLDGLRGLAAFYVLLFHVIADGKEVLTAQNFLLNFLRFGHEAVVVFIVLSGFVLTLPMARAPRVTLAGGLGKFFLRRARRILPAYYASLLMLPLFFLVIESLKGMTAEGADWTRVHAMFFSADMLAHLFLLHNLSADWAGSINPVLWSLSTEWWIYFVFALLLLPIWRGLGIACAVCISILLGLLPTGLAVLGYSTIAGFPHLLGAFGLGMMSAAWLSLDKHISQFVHWHKTLQGVVVVAFLVLVGIVVAAPSLRVNTETRWITDLLIALICALLIQLMAATVTTAHPAFAYLTIAVRILESRLLLFLGRISYSLYLTHLIVWSMFGITLGLAPIQRFITISLDPMPMRIFVLLPVQLLFAYGFYLLFEKPFLFQHKHAAQTIPSRMSLAEGHRVE